MLNKLKAILSMPHLKMKFPTLTGEIMTVKVDQKQVRQCYAKSLKVTLYPSTREPTKPHPTVGGDTQVMSMDEGSPIRALTIYQASPDNVFNVDPHSDTTNRGPKPIEELIKLLLGPKPGQCTQLSRDLTSHKHRCTIDVLHRNMNLFAW